MGGTGDPGATTGPSDEPGAGAGGEGDHAAAAIADLRRARRRRRLAAFDAGEAVYRAYITFVLSGIAVWLLSGVVGDTRLGAGALGRVAADGSRVVGAVIGAGWALGARAGGRGGPLALEAADVRHVLLSPVDRAVALRSPALRQLRSTAAVAAGAGAVAGLLAWRRCGGDPAAWVAVGAAVAALAVAGGLGLAMVASGRRFGRLGGGALAVGLLAWSGADAALGTATAPATWLGQVALWPLRFRATGVAGAAVAVILAMAGVASVAGTSIEAAERRSALVGQLRFAATLRDVRTVVVLRRQLSQEQPRSQPWVRLATRNGPVRWAAWRRSLRGIARYPLVRLVRMAVLGAAAGAAGVGVWAGTTPLVLAVGACLYVAGLDAVEPLAQELDHPDRRDAAPVERGVLCLALLAPSVLLMVAVAAVGAAAAVVVVAATGGDVVLAAEVGAVVALPAAAAGVAGAAVSVLQGAPDPASALDTLLPPEGAGVRAIGRLVVPPGLAVLAALPLLVAHHPPPPATALSAAATATPLPLLGAVAAGTWVRYRDAMRAWWTSAMEEAGAARRPTTPGAAP
ncbi:MAG TPA: hypothetical protein VFP61_07220 [Acidimicrobiales bacterium]|nr:hypothetical protein [Acidimicrobiales bacterium]